MGSFLLSVVSPSSSSLLCTGVSESSCSSSGSGRSSLHLNSKRCALWRRMGSFSETQLQLSRCSRPKGRVMAWAEGRPSSDAAAASIADEDSFSHLISPVNEKSGFLNGVLNLRIGSVAAATALLANAVCGNALAEAGAAAAGSEESSNFMFVVICIGEAIALTGAAVGGILARQRKVELEKINAQLRQINVNLRRQSRMETYAPNLTYAPVGGGRMADLQFLNDPVREELMQALKTGKRWLREQKPANAFAEFESALSLAQQLKDTAEEKKAARGLGASCQRQGKYKEAIPHHLLVLELSKRTGENSGDTEAYGAIADCYTELGDLETAGKYYDRYIELLETDETL